MANQLDNHSMITSQDIIDLRRYRFEEQQVVALENLLLYVIDEAASLRFSGCEQQLRQALAELLRETGRSGVRNQR
jgi:hypothetical protein